MNITIKQISEVLKATFKGEGTQIPKKAQFDSRNVVAGDLFVALKGEEFDGHAYVKMAQEKGAVAALVSEEQDIDFPQIIVEDTLDAFQQLASFYKQNVQPKTLAITGSCGKTSSKEMAALILDAYKTEGNFNNHIGVPYTLCAMPESAQCAVIEMGMSHPDEIRPLTELTKPDVALVTNIGPAHIEAFGTVDKIADEKLSIALGLSEEGTLVVPHAWAEKAQAVYNNVVTFSLDDDSADAVVTQVQSSDEGLEVEANICGQLVNFFMPHKGMYMVENALAVLLSVYALEEDVQTAAKKLAQYKPLKGRGETHEVFGIKVVDEAYNANPLSMQAALDNFKRLSSRRHIAVLGEMRELGACSQDEHKKLAKLCTYLDGVVVVGKEARVLYNALPATQPKAYFENETQVHFDFAGGLNKDDALLIKGSKSNNLFNLVTRIVENGEHVL